MTSIDESRHARKTDLVLRGDRCQCGACRDYFNSTAAFDRHRIGPHGTPERRCLTVAEMEARGFAPNATGFWTTRRMPRLAFREPRNTADLPPGVSGVGVGT